MRSLIAAVLFTGLAGLAAAQDGKDGKTESKAGRFTATFPDKPKTVTKKAANPGDVDLEITIAEKGGGAFAVIYSDLPPTVLKDQKPAEILSNGQKGLVDNFGAKVTSAKETTFGTQKLPAREIVAEKDTLQLRITIILAENRLYQVFVVGSKDLIGGKEADAFLKSFEVTKSKD